MGGSQSTIPEYERLQDTDEDESDGIQQHFAQPVRRLSQAENLRSPSQLNPPRQAQLHDSHRTRAPSQRDPYPIPVHPTHSVGPTAPAHSVGPTGNTAAHATHSVAAVRPVASRTPAPCAISYTQSSKTVILPTEHRASNLVHHPPSTTASSPAQELGTGTARFDSTASFGNRTQPIRDRDPVPTATYADQLGATQKTSQGATATTAAAQCAIPSAAAGGKGPPDSTPDGSTDSRKTDRRSDSAFYCNATYTCGTNDAVQPFVLKEVPLTPFDGDVREYPRFRDRFLDIIEARPNLAPRYKLVHLLQYLRGEPLRMANRLRLTDDNYFTVVDRLEKRYGNKVSYHNVLVRDLAKLKPLTSTMLSDVTRFYDDAFQLITDLQPFIKTDSPIEHALLIGLIPVKLRLYLANETSYAGDRTANGLLKALDQLVCQGRQSILTGLDLSGEPDTDIDLVPRPVLWDDDASSEHTTREDSPEASIQGSQPSSSEPAGDQAAVAVNASTERRLKERRTCPLCGGLHTAFRCDVYTNVNARMRRIMKLKLCLLCLREGHQAATCPLRTTNYCKICRAGPRNRAICMAANRTQAKERRRSPARTTGSSVDSKKPDPERHTQQKSVNWGDGKSTSTATNLRSSEAQSSSSSTPNRNRKKKSKKHGAVPSGRGGTPRPPTTSTAEGMKQKTADACGDSRLLPARQGLKPTDRCSNNDESTQFDQQAEADGTDNSDAAADRHELRDEEDTSSESSGKYSGSLPSSPGHCSNAEIDDWEDADFQPRDSTLLPTDAIYCASSTTEPTTLLECIKATAENPTKDVSREVLIFFDSGSNRSFVTTELARDLSLPRDWPCSLRVSTFGNELPATIEGFSTSIVLRSKHRRLQPLAIIAGDCIVPSVRTALIDPTDLNKLRRCELSPSPIQVTPDILIGQDLVSHFKRRHGPTLPSGFYVVHSILGPMLGGSATVPTTVHEAATSPSAASSARARSRHPNWTDASPPSPTLPALTHRKRSPVQSEGSCTAIAIQSESTHSVEKDLKSPSDAAHHDFSLPVEKNEFSRSTTPTSRRTDRHSPSSSTKGPRPSRKQQNPLDISAPLPPPTTHVTLQQELWTDPSATNLNTIYQLSINLPDCTMTVGKDRGGSEGRPVTEDLSSRQHLALGPARRADRADQAILASHRSPPPDTTLSVVPAVHSPSAARQMCAFCNNTHTSTECTTFQGVSRRMRRLQTLKRCFICLAIGHPSSKCPERTTSICRHCQRSHHPSLCRDLEDQQATDSPASRPTVVNQRSAMTPATADSVAKAARTILRSPNATHSVAKGAGPVPRIPDAAHSVAPGTFPPALNHFRVDQTSSTKKAGTRAAPRSAKRRSAAVSTTPAQGPSKQPSRPTYKLTTAKSSGKRRQVHATIAADPSSTDHPAPSKTSNKQIRNCTSRGKKTEHPSRDEETQHRSMSPRQDSLTETPARPTQHADVRCELCAQHHRAERCTSFPSIEERRQRAQYLWLCFTCLSNDHRTEDCPNTVMSSCTLCDYDIHHHALCAAAFRQATVAAEASSTPVVVPAEAHQRLLAPHPAEGLHQSTSAFVQRHTAQSIRGSTCKRIFRGGFGPNPLGLPRMPVQTQAPPKDPLQADPTHSVGASQAQNTTSTTSNASTRGGTASSRARGRGYVMKRPSATTRPPYDVSPDYPDTDPPTVTDQSEPTKPPTGTAPEETGDATEAVETPDEQSSTTNPASNAEEAVETPDAHIIPSNPSHSDGPSPTAPIRPPTTTGPSNWPNFSSQQAVVALLPTAAGPSISRPPANIANIFGEQALAALVDQVAQQATLRITAALDKKLGNIEELPRERSDDQYSTTMAEDRQAPKRQNRKPKK